MDRIPPLKYLALFSVWKSSKQNQNCQQIARLNIDIIPLLLRGRRMKFCYFEILLFTGITSGEHEYEMIISKYSITKFHKEPRIIRGGIHFAFFLDPYLSGCMIFKFKGRQFLSCYLGQEGCQCQNEDDSSIKFVLIDSGSETGRVYASWDSILFQSDYKSNNNHVEYSGEYGCTNCIKIHKFVKNY